MGIVHCQEKDLAKVQRSSPCKRQFKVQSGISGTNSSFSLAEFMSDGL